MAFLQLTRPGLLTIVCLGLVVHADPAGAQIGPLRLDGVAATVGGRSPGPNVTTVLRSDVELRARLKLAAGPAPLGVRKPLPRSLLAATLSEIVGEHLIAREAARIRSVEPRAADVRAELKRLTEAAGGTARVAALLGSLSADASELLRIAERRAVVGAFLRSNLEGATVVTEAEIDAAIAGDASRHGIAATTVREAVRTRLWRAALDRSIAHWVRALKARTVVKIHVDFAAS